VNSFKLTSFRDAIRRHNRDESGVTSTEFTITATLFVIILFWTIETGFIMVRWVMLERAVDIATRDLRINGLPEDLKDADGNVSNETAHNYIRDMICSETAVINDCENVLFLELSSIDSGAGVIPSTGVKCRDRSGPVDPATDLPTVNVGERNKADAKDLMYLRACVVVDPILPANYAMPLPLDATGGVALIVDSAYVNEPG